MSDLRHKENCTLMGHAVNNLEVAQPEDLRFVLSNQTFVLLFSEYLEYLSLKEVEILEKL